MNGEKSRHWAEHPIALVLLSAFLSSGVTGLIGYGAIQATVQNNKTNIDKLYDYMNSSLAGERRANDATAAGIFARLTLLEQRDKRVSIDGRFQLAAYRDTEGVNAAVPKNPPPKVPKPPAVFDKTIEKLEAKLMEMNGTKKFSELSEDEKDDIRTVTAKLYLARAWRAWCNQNETLQLYCAGRFGEP